MYIGIDDTDSKHSMCTTYVGAVVMKRAESLGARRADYPWLVRLNPNCPFKTRGNAAVCIPLDLEPPRFEEVWDTVVETVMELADTGRGADPGVVAFDAETRSHLHEFYLKAVRELVDLEETVELCESNSLDYWAVGESRGLIGAVAAVGAIEETLTTYELLAYRSKVMWGKERLVDPESVKEMDRMFGQLTFDNYDYEKDEVRVTPHTPCPVLLGIRGLNPDVLPYALSTLKLGEPIEFYEVFRTNQATDLHYVTCDIGSIRPLTSVVIRGRVVRSPTVTQGGHVFFEVSDGSGRVVVAVYEPTGEIRRVVSKLVLSDEVVVFGSVKEKPEGLTVNLEKLKVLRLADLIVERAPRCPHCRKSMKSVGKGKGYRCRRCGFYGPDLNKVSVKVGREIVEGFYEVAVSARRHIVRPLSLHEQDAAEHL